MDKERQKQLIAKFNNLEILPEELILLEKAIEIGEIGLQELKEISDLDRQLDFRIPEPGENLRAAFYANLAKLKASKSRGNAITGLNIWLTNLGFSQSAIRLAYAFVLVIVGFGIGQWTQSSIPYEKIDALTTQVSEMKGLMMLTLIKEPIATDRLKAVNLAMDADKVDERMILALLNTLNNDDNVNVRLASVEVLLRYSNNPVVRQGLVEAIPNQDNATMQYALAEAMVLMQEKNSIERLQELMQKEDLDEDVRNKIHESIQKLS
ncbi:MAG TPA: HEAT repeat domain-containing protein [Cyclobacteriaceae bacterium]|jgi:hypothetical protein